LTESEYRGTLIIREDGGFYYVTFRPEDTGGLFNLGRFAGAPDEVVEALKE